jgi:hypothetical protein
MKPEPENHSREESPSVNGKPADSKKYLFDNPRNVKILFVSYYSSLFLLLILDFFVHGHPHFGWQEWPEFYAVYGFVACVVLVIAAKYILRPLVKRRADYYD